MKRFFASNYDDTFLLATGDRLVIKVPHGEEYDISDLPLEVDFAAFSASHTSEVTLRATGFCSVTPAELFVANRQARRAYEGYRDELAAYHAYRNNIITSHQKDHP